jgi:hypothetical protein
LWNIPEEKRSQHIGSIFKGEKRWERVEWIDLALDRDTWWPVLDTAIIYLIAHNAGNF